MKNYPFVSIIFPNYNGGKEPLECLSSIDNLYYPKNKIEIIVVDNASSDGSDKKIKKQFPKVTLIKMEKNEGFAKAINTGITKSHGTYIFIGNDDLVFEKNSLKKLIDYAGIHNNVGILGGKIFLKNKPQKTTSTGYMFNRWTGNIYQSPNTDAIHEPDWLQGCALLTSKKVLQRIGMLDESFALIYFEDFDLCIRAKKAGYKVVYVPDAHFYHGSSITMDKNKQDKYYQWYRNKIRFIIKHLPIINILCILFAQCLCITPYRAIVLHDGRLIPFVKGLFWNMKNLSQTFYQRSTL